MDKVLNILILEDVEVDADLVKRTLDADGLKFDSLRVSTKKAFIEAIRSTHFDIILSDHSLPQFDSMQALKLCRRTGLLIPFILITGTVSEEYAVLCLKQGVDDYILKSNLSRLPSAVRNAIENRKLQEQRLKNEIELVERNEQLVKINQELDSFVYSVSHNLRAPLMSVLGLVNIAQKDDQQRDRYFENYFNMIRASIGKLDDTLREILEYSRNTRSSIDFAPINVQKIVNECCEELRYLPDFDKVKLSLQVEGEHEFLSDEYRTKIIFRNLISNAVKYYDKFKTNQFLKIGVETNATEAVITLEDNGVGIREDLLPKVTNMFFRGSDNSNGAGLGLYIVSESVKKMGGQFFIESTFGKGTRIKITLPTSESSRFSGESTHETMLSSPIRQAM